MRPDVLAARIDLRIAELRVIAAKQFVRCHGTGLARPHAVTFSRRPAPARAVLPPPVRAAGGDGRLP
jgi:hypothetical protein